MPVSDRFIHEQDYSDLNAQAAVEHLSQAIQCNTTGYVDTTLVDYSEFLRLHQLMRDSFPHVMAAGTMEIVDHSVLITLPGRDSSLRPALFMSHMDVVPVVKGTLEDWTYGPFSGAVEDGYIWGRGTLDIKQMVFGILEAADYLLARGSSFQRTVYLAFGQDEETLNTGAYAIGQLLKSRGVTLEFVLDEGGGSLESGALYGAPSLTVSQIGLFEKGYADLRIAAQSKGGHSSRPWGGTSLGRLAQAIARVVEHPFAIQLPGVTKEALRQLAPHITVEPLATLVQDLERNEAAIAQYFHENRELFPMVSTTIAPTMITEGSNGANVMPQNMEAVINFRISAQDSCESIFRHCEQVINDPSLSLSYIQHNDPSQESRADGYGYHQLVETLSHYYKDVVFLPSLVVGSTDARQYECICDTCLRYGPFLEEGEIQHMGIHGTNERISIRAYLQGIRCLIHLMEQTCL